MPPPEEEVTVVSEELPSEPPSDDPTVEEPSELSAEESSLVEAAPSSPPSDKPGTLANDEQKADSVIEAVEQEEGKDANSADVPPSSETKELHEELPLVGTEPAGKQAAEETADADGVGVKSDVAGSSA